MPAPPLENTLEGGSDGTDITQANSGAASGDAFDIVATAGTTTMNYDNSVAHDGSFSMEVATGATPGNAYRGWTNLGDLTGAVYFRFYLRVPSAPVASQWIARFHDGAGSRSADFLYNTSGFLRAGNAAGTSLTVGDVVVSTSSWVRIEIRLVSSTTAGEFWWKLWNSPEATGTPDDEVNLTGLVLGPNTDDVRFGAISGTSGNTNYTYRFDDLAVSTVDWIGPTQGAISDATEKLRTVRSNLRLR